MGATQQTSAALSHDVAILLFQATLLKMPWWAIKGLMLGLIVWPGVYRVVWSVCVARRQRNR